MSQIWRWIGGFAFLLVLVVVVLPSRTHVEREVFVDARPATVFALLNDFRQIEKWASRTEADPNARIEFLGPPRGVGAGISWNGRIIGQGSQVIIQSRPHERVAMSIDRGDGSNATMAFELDVVDEMTRVSWSWDVDHRWNIAGRVVGLVQSRVISREYDADLANLGDLAESLPRADFSDLEVEQIVVEAVEIAYLRTTSIPEATAISEAMGDSYFDILSFIDEFGLQEAGAPLSITRTFSGSELAFDAAIPVRGLTDATPRNSGRVRIGETYAGPVIRVRHVGSYATLGNTHDKVAAYLAAMGIKRNGDAWESYIGDPTRTDESVLLTYIYYPVRNVANQAF